MRNLIFAVICLLAVIPCQAEIITVDDDGLADFNNIQAAIDDSNDGDIIEVKVGTYTGEGNQDIDPNGKAITITSTDPNDPKVVAATIIDCNGSAGDPHRGFYFHSDEDAESVLEGLTITNGWDSVGAGISCNGASPTIRHCVISGNRARHQGGGLYCRFSSAVITNCTFRDNTAIYGHGGGIFCLGGRPDISTCIISDNNAGSSGGGLFNNNSGPVLLDCDFTANSAGDYGGGVCNTNNSMPIMTDCTFSDNRAGYCGDDSYSEGEPCLDVSNGVTDAKMYDIMSSGSLSGEYQVSSSSGIVYYVNGLCGNDSWSGLDPCCAGPDGPKQTIQAAIDDAEDGDTIVVYPHIYLENIAIEANISLTGIDPNEPNVVEATVIDGGGGGSVVTFAGAEDPNCLLTGFTITNGSGTSYRGGGIYGEATQATISKCIITGNSASDLVSSGYGGGIYDCDGLITDCNVNNNTAVVGGGGLAYCDGMVTDCVISNNHSDSWPGGGGMYNYKSSPTITKCTFIGNLAGWGGGMRNEECSPTVTNCAFMWNLTGGGGAGMYNYKSSPILINCTFSGNYSWGLGAGMHNYNNSNPTLTNCAFIQNDGVGGGGMCNDDGSNPTVTNCAFSNNYGDLSGGGMQNIDSNPTLTNCMFRQNYGGWGGGGIGNSTSSPILSNCTFSGNKTYYNGGGMVNHKSSPIVNNCIFWGNIDEGGMGESAQISGGTPDVRFSCIQDDDPNDIYIPFGGATNKNIDDDPLFVDANNPDPNLLDYHLLFGSPCINAGDPNRPVEPNETDIDGQPRVIGGRIDMGADEVVIAAMRFTPAALNPFSQGKWVKAHLVLPEGFAVEDVNDNTPALLEPFSIESDHINVFVNEDGLVEIEIAFERAAFCEDGVNDETTEVRVIGSLSNDGYFYGTDTIRIFNGGPRYVAVLATYWLEAGCGVPDWCGGADLDHSSTVDFVDFALFDGCCIEVVGE